MCAGGRAGPTVGGRDGPTAAALFFFLVNPGGNAGPTDGAADGIEGPMFAPAGGRDGPTPPPPPEVGLDGPCPPPALLLLLLLLLPSLDIAGRAGPMLLLPPPETILALPLESEALPPGLCGPF